MVWEGLDFPQDAQTPSSGDFAFHALRRVLVLALEYLYFGNAIAPPPL